jgi:undecaprenyl diphosphate synthase
MIMDGNGRWARERGLPTLAGHRAGVEVIRRVLSACRDHGVTVLTLFAFSSENWQRPREEVRGLMALFMRYLRGEVRKLHRNGIRLRIIGDRSRFSRRLAALMQEAETLTAQNSGFTLVIAADYGGQWDLVQAARALACEVAAGRLDPADIDAARLENGLCLGDLPRPDLLIRTGGDHRISNFLLWQLAYTELYFTERYWPDFDDAELAAAINDYASRERRFGTRPQADAVEQARC